MGVHILCLTPEGDHPDWDYLRRGWDREFAQLMAVEGDWGWSEVSERGTLEGDQQGVREAVEAQDWSGEYKKRAFHLLDLLKQGGCWVELSY